MSSWYKSRDGLNWCYVSAAIESLLLTIIIDRKNSEQKSLALKCSNCYCLLAGVVERLNKRPLAQNMGISNNYFIRAKCARKGQKKKKLREAEKEQELKRKRRNHHK